MNELSRRASIGLIAFLALITLAVSAFTWREMRQAPAPIVIHEPTQAANPPVAMIKVQVTGAVKRSGVYTLPQGARGEDALKMAGGALPNANPDAINLAERLEDGQRLEVPVKGEAIEEGKEAPTRRPATDSQHKRGKTPPSRKININTASIEQLQELPGVGEKTAENILQVRKNNGGFRSVQDLMQVHGISQAKFKKMEAFLRSN